LTRLFAIVIVALSCTLASAQEPAAHDAQGFAIRDGDTVVFLGDSITAARTYGKLIENYTLLRFPERKVRFVNAGWGGDTAAGGLARLDRDVFSKGATLVTVAYGINDIGWGGKADNEHRQKYLDSIRGIVEACNKHRVRVYICSAALTAGGTKDDDYLQKMCDEGMAISRSLGGGAIDVQRAMRRMNAKVLAHNAATKDDKDKQTMHAADGIHLSDLGQLAMAFAILKGLGAPADVSSVVVDAAGPKLVKAEGCTVDGLAGQAGRVEFVRHDRGVPLNNGPFWGFNFRFVPIPDELNRYTVAVRNLPPGKYDLRVDDRPVSTYSSEDLGRGVDITTAAIDWWQPGGPWAAQAMLLKSITDARHELATAETLSHEFIKNNPHLPELIRQADEINAKIETLQRTLVQPVPYRFVIQPSVPASQPK
jgi:lysophospholipase L1-like esterase